MPGIIYFKKPIRYDVIAIRGKEVDSVPKEKRSEIMSHIRSKGDKSTELKLIALFRANRISGWRRNSKIFGNPDFVFPKYKICVFVDGCFWHGCKCKKGRIPKTNKKYWKNKIERNKLRDKVVSISLKNKGYSVIRIRECQLKKNPNRQLSRIINTTKIAISSRA